MGNMCIIIICEPDYDVIKSEINFVSYQAILLHDQKVQIKT